MIKVKKGFMLKDSVTLKEFSMRCNKCGSHDIDIIDDVSCGTCYTGIYGSIDIKCNGCGKTEEIVGY